MVELELGGAAQEKLCRSALIDSPVEESDAVLFWFRSLRIDKVFCALPG
jgi:hypothetical protein